MRVLCLDLCKKVLSVLRHDFLVDDEDGNTIPRATGFGAPAQCSRSDWFCPSPYMQRANRRFRGQIRQRPMRSLNPSFRRPARLNQSLFRTIPNKFRRNEKDQIIAHLKVLILTCHPRGHSLPVSRPAMSSAAIAIRFYSELSHDRGFVL